MQLTIPNFLDRSPRQPTAAPNTAVSHGQLVSTQHQGEESEDLLIAALQEADLQVGCEYLQLL